MKTKHSPLPWSRNINAKYPIYYQSSDRSDTRHICSILHGQPDQEREANLRFIIQAVNNHYDLVKCLRNVVEAEFNVTKWPLLQSTILSVLENSLPDES